MATIQTFDEQARNEIDGLAEWYVVAAPRMCYMSAAGKQVSSRTGKLMPRRFVVRFDEESADTWFGRWTLQIAPRNQEHRIKARRPRNAAECEYIRYFVTIALSRVSNGDLQVWSHGRAPALADLREMLIAAYPL